VTAVGLFEGSTICACVTPLPPPPPPPARGLPHVIRLLVSFLWWKTKRSRGGKEKKKLSHKVIWFIPLGYRLYWILVYFTNNLFVLLTPPPSPPHPPLPPPPAELPEEDVHPGDRVACRLCCRWTHHLGFCQTVKGSASSSSSSHPPLLVSHRPGQSTEHLPLLLLLLLLFSRHLDSLSFFHSIIVLRCDRPHWTDRTHTPSRWKLICVAEVIVGFNLISSRLIFVVIYLTGKLKCFSPHHPGSRGRCKHRWSITVFRLALNDE